MFQFKSKNNLKSETNSNLYVCVERKHQTALDLRFGKLIIENDLTNVFRYNCMEKTKMIKYTQPHEAF
jgi:hypothetical protein